MPVVTSPLPPVRAAQASRPPARQRSPNASGPSCGSSRLAVARIHNGEQPASSSQRIRVPLPGLSDGSFPVRKEAACQRPHGEVSKQAFEALAREFNLDVASAATDTLRTLRDQLLSGSPGSTRPRPLSAPERKCMLAGLNLEPMRHKGVWNVGTGDLVPFIVDSRGWPAARALRIVDTETGAIHLYRRGECEQHHYPGQTELLPEVQDDEVILLRHARHFNLVRRERDSVIDTVPSDGDCFFSCISKALGHTDIAASNLALRHDLVEYLWSRPNVLKAAATFDAPLQDMNATEVAPSSGYTIENQILVPLPDYQLNDDLAAAIVMESVKTYQDPMSRELADGPLSAPAFNDVEAQLSRKLVTNAANALTGVQDMSPVVHELENALSTARDVFRTGNAQALKQRALTAGQIVNAARQTYADRINAVLADHPGGLQQNRLEQEHRRITEETLRGMQQRMRSEVDAKEPMEGHFKQLDAYIQKDWNAASEENDQRVARRQRAASATSSQASGPDDQREQPEQAIVKLMPAMIKLYNLEMQQRMQDEVHAGPVLARIHEMLVEDIVGRVAGIYGASDDTQLRQRLATEFEAAFNAHRERNKESSKRVQSAITKVLEKAYARYVAQIERVLIENPAGLDATKFASTNAEIRQQVGAELTASLTAIRRDEPLGGHLLSVETQMDDYALYVQQANAENLAAHQAAAASPALVTAAG